MNISKLINKTRKNPGAGSICEYLTKEGSFCILGKRFGQRWKVSTGGAMDKDETLWQTILRENREELLFHPMCSDSYYKHKDVYHFNFEMNYFTLGLMNVFFETEAELRDMVLTYLNRYARIANAVRRALVDNTAIDEGDLENFIKYNQVFRVSDETTAFLKGYKAGEPVPEKVRKEVSMYTEYSEFKVMRKEDVLKTYTILDGNKTHRGLEIPESLQQTNQAILRNYFKQECDSVLKCLP